MLYCHPKSKKYPYEIPTKMGVPVLLLMPITQRIMGQMEAEMMIQDGHQILQMMHGL